MIQLYRVTKYYEGVPALSDVSFDVEKGEFVFLTGPSGAGKSTLLKVIFCAERADEGQIIIQGMNTFHLKSSTIPYLRRNMGFVFQDYKLLPHKTVFENITLALKVVGTPYGEIERRAFQVLKKVGMHDKRHLTPPKLSGGEQQKVAVARALVNEPQVLLADEPTGNLDIQSAQEVFRLFRDINMKGTTVLVATHDRDMVRKMRRRIISMERGRIIDDGSNAVKSQSQLSFLEPAESADGPAAREGEL
ncbi:MAG TPA: cell division ATP-binding protein FtsE [Nitrospirota bacterium]|nr:cell division ATP-binding protein FtsE [Nitrospirota bacterium]